MESFPSQPEPQGPVAAVTGGARLRGWALASVLAGLMLTLLLAALDQTIVGTALPRIIGELNGLDRYTWVVTTYLLTSTMMIPIVGKLSDQFGRKWFLIVGVVIFLAGSALSGASQTMNQLILFRGLQGIGGGMLMSLVFTLVGDIFTPAERARWQGLFTAVFGLASVIGPAAGGWITDNSTWRWVFYVNLPIGMVALVALFVWLPANISVRNMRYRGWAAIRRIDFPGVFTAAAATVCLLLGLTWGGNQIYDWSSPQVVGVLVAAGVLLVAFVIVERFAAEPILPISLFRNQVFAVGALLSLAVGMALFAVAIYLPLFIQGVLGQTATNSGAVITPLTLTMAFGAAIVGQIIARVGRYQFAAIIGAVIMAFGIYLLTQMSISTDLLTVTRNMIVIGLGMGMIQPVMTLAVQNAIPRTQLGVGTGAVTYLRSMGSTLGTAILGAVVTNTLSNQLTKRLPAEALRLPASLRSPATLQQLLLSPDAKHKVVTEVTQRAVQQAVPQAINQAMPAAVQQAITQQVDKVLPGAIAQATAHVPPGPQHAQQVAAITQQVTAQVTAQVSAQVNSPAVTAQIRQQLAQHITPTVTTSVTQQVSNLFNQLFDATRHALAAGIHDGFVVGVIVAIGIFVLTLFLKDVPLRTRHEPAPMPVESAAAGPGQSQSAAGAAQREVAPQSV